MSGSQVASNSGSALALASTPVQILKIVRPAAGKTEIFHASFDGSVKIDFTAIANEQVTFFHDSKNQSLHVIFTDGSQAIIEPFFDSMGVMSNFVFEMAPGQFLDSAEFASQFPITRDQSVLPALTKGPAESGAEFNDPSVDSLPPNIKLALLPEEELPTFVFHETIPVRLPADIAVLPLVEEEEAPPSLPSALPNAPAQLDDDNLPGGNPGFLSNLVDGASPDDVAPVTATGVLGYDYGSGGTGTVLLTGAVLPADFSASVDPTGTVLTIHQISTNLDVLRVTLADTTSGAYTVTELNAIDHPAGDQENNLEFTINYQVASAGGTVDGTLVVNVDDDTPIAVAGTSSGTVDEDGVFEGAADAGPGDGILGGPGDFVDLNADGDNDESTVTGSVSGLFQSGADGPLTYSLSTDTGGLTAQGLTSGGVALAYSVVGNVLTAEAGAGNTVFTFTLNGGTGAWTFNLEDQLDHPTLDGLPGDNTENELTINLGSLIQATDTDGDTVSAIGSVSVLVDDDTPIAVAGTSSGTVDEDGVVELVGPDGDGIAGGDGDVAGEAVVATGLVTGLFQSGADEALTYSLSGNFTALIAQGLKSGGVDLSYSLVSGVSVDTVTATAGVGGEEVFTFALDKTTGAWTFTLIDQLDHPTLNGLPGDNTENDLTIQLGSLIQATDADGDTVTAIGSVSVLVDDDTPIAVSGVISTGRVDEDGVLEGEADAGPGDGIPGGPGDFVDPNTDGDNDESTVTGNINPLFLFLSGADEPLTFSVATDTSALEAQGLKSGGVDLSYTVVGDVLTATAGVGGEEVFTFTLLGNGDYTFRLVDQLDHPTLNGLPGDNTENELTILLGSLIQATDADGDTVTAPVVRIVVNDDVPDQNAVTVNINVDEDELSTGITDNDLTTTVATFSGAQIIGLVNSGADEPVNVSLNPAIEGVATGLFSQNVSIVFDVISPTQVNGVAGARTVFTLVQTAGGDAQLGTSDDVFTFTLLDQVDHVPNNLGGGDEENIVLSLASVFVATDFDGDSIIIDAGATVTIENDVPDAVVVNPTAAAIVLDESPVAPGGDGIVSATANFSVNFAAANFGADGAGSASYALVLTGSNVASGLFALDATDVLGVGGDGDGIGQGAQIVLNQSGNVITGSIGAITYFTIQIDPATGVVTFTDNTANNLWHSNTGNPDDPQTLTLSDPSLLQLVQTVTDADGDSDAAAINLGSGVFTVQDDGPDAVVVNPTAAAIVLDETRPVGTETDGDSAPAGLDTVTVNLAGNFAAVPDFGSDGPGGASYSLVLTGSNVASGLFALGVGGAAGASIVLNQAAPGADIIGTANGSEHFRISLNPATGVVTFSQSLNVWHANTTSDDDTATLTLANAAALQVVQTVTDADGDVDTAAINLGTGVFQIEDDGPNAVVANAVAAAIVLDETRPVGSEEDGDSAPAGLDTVTVNLAGNFAAVTDFGSDGPGGASYSLVLTGSNVASGLFALGVGGAAGASIVLNQVAPGADITGTANGSEHFRISLNPATGVVTFSQSLNVWHANTTSDDDTATLTLANAAALQVVQTVTDADGDTDTAGINLGAGVFQIEDDGPDAVVANAVAAAIVLDETRPVGTETDGDSNPAGLNTVTVNLAGNFAAVTDFGSDGPGGATYSLVLTGSNVASGLFALDAADTTLADLDGIGQGAQIVLNQSGNTITGSAGGTNYFTITLNPATGQLTFTQLNNIWHASTASDDDTATLTLANANLLTLVQTVTDADGDSVNASIDLGAGVFTIQDDGPVQNTVTAAADTLVLDESAVGTDTAGGTPPVGLASITANYANNFSVPVFGTDGPGSASYKLELIANSGSGLFALDATDIETAIDPLGKGAEILLVQTPDGVVHGKVGGVGADYFTISVDGSGVVTFTRLLNIWHDDTANPDDPETLTTAAGNLKLTQTVTDADGDSVNASIDLGAGVFTIQDDGPVQNTVTAAADTLVLDESAVGTDTAGGTPPVGLASITANYANNFSVPVFGTDGPGSASYKLELIANSGSGLFALDATDIETAIDPLGKGAEILLVQTPDGVVHGKVGGVGADYFTISVDGSGVVTFTRLLNIWHDDTANPDDPETLTTAAGNLKLTQTVTDADGDSVNASIDLGAGVFTIQDDGPVQNTVTAAADTLVLDESAVGTDTAGGTPPVGLASITANYANNFSVPVFGTDGPGSASYKLELIANSGSGLFALDATDIETAIDPLGKGAEILLVQTPDGVVHGKVGGVGADYFTISVDGSGVVTFTRLLNIWHDDTANPDDPETLTTAAGNLKLTQTVTDADGDSVNASIDLGAGVFTIQDDGPVQNTVTAAADTLVLDESAVGTDTAGGTPPVGLASITANYANNFSVPVFGTDGPGSASYKLELIANSGSGLFALDATDIETAIDPLGKGAEILLVQTPDGVVHGKVGGVGADYFTISVDGSGVVTFTRLLNIWHDDTANPDDPETLTTAAGNLKLTQTVTDADGDSVNASIDLGAGVFTIQDDGPVQNTVTAAADTLVLDESAVGTDTAGGTPPVGLASITANYANNFSAANFGTDGAGSASYALVLTGAGVASGLFALDATDIETAIDPLGKGAEILLVQTPDGVVHGKVGGVGADYFTISVDGSGVVTFTRLLNIWHDDTANPDDPETLTTAAGNLKLTQTVTDADGDSVNASIDLGAGVFTIQDDGPVQNTVTAAADTLVLDESAVGTDTAGGTPPVGLASITANYANNFSAANFGTDGAGSASYALVLTGAGVASGLFALDAADTSAVDGDGIGQGASIVLNKVGNNILGQVGAVTYFTISVDGNGVVTFTDNTANNLWHSNTGNPDDPQTLTLSDPSLLRLVQTVTDADGDSVNASINLGAGVFTIQDDGPVQNTVIATADPLVLDESAAGTDTPAGALPTGLATVTANYANNFSAANFGTDGAGSASYALVLTGAGVASGLFALDAADTSAVDGDGIGQGASIVLNKVGNNILGQVGAVTYFTISVDGNGVVTFTDNTANNLWHSNTGNPDDPQTLTLSDPSLLRLVQTVTDADGDSVNASINLGAGVFTIQDDGPVAGALSKPIVPSGVPTNLMLILDVSGSMDNGSGLTGLSRLDLLKAATIELLEQYQNQGPVSVRVITFSTDAAEHTSNWESVTAAKNFILGLTAGGNTDYDDATAAAINAFADPGKLATPGFRNVSYFVSDGDPNPDSEELGPGEEAIWTTFLNNNDINSFAIGIGTGITDVTKLDPVAYDGRGAGTNTDGLIVTDLEQLTPLLVITALTATGNLGVDSGNSFGTDGPGYIKSITANGITYTYDPASGGSVLPSGGAGTFDTSTNELTIALLSGARFVVDLDDGAYTYVPSSITAGFSEAIGYTLIDTDGDQMSNTLTINVTGVDLPPIVRDDLVITNITGGSAAITIPDFALLYNDTDANFETISVTATSGASDGTVSAPPNPIFTDNGDTDGGSFTYTGSDGSPPSDTGVVTVDRDQAGQSQLDGTGLGDILIGRAAANDVILGNEGNDVLIGDSGNDTLNGGTGKDLLVGGAGADIYDFNATTESGNTIATADIITGWEVADVIDVNSIDANINSGGNQNFTFGGVDSSVDANEISVFQSGADTVVHLDTNGVAGAEMMFVLTGITAGSLTAANFNL